VLLRFDCCRRENTWITSSHFTLSFRIFRPEPHQRWHSGARGDPRLLPDTETLSWEVSRNRLRCLGWCSTHTPDPKACLCWAFLKSSWRSVELIHSWVCRCHSSDVLACRSRELFVSSMFGGACCLSRELPFLSAEPPRWPGTICCLKPWPGGGSGGGGRSKKCE